MSRRRRARMPFIVADEIFNDLPDGAYFAAMAEQGFEVEDIVDAHERTHACTQCGRTFKTPRALYDHERGKHKMHKAAR